MEEKKNSGLMWSVVAIVMLLLLTGCVAEEGAGEAGNGSSRQIVLSAYLPQPQTTRADSSWLASETIPYGKSIGVYAYYHNNATWGTSEGNRKPNFMYNQQATNNGMGGGFTYAPLKYWPNEETDKVSFFAYYPYINPSAPGSIGLTPVLANTAVTGMPTFTFTVKDNVKEQIDFMCSDLIVDLPKSRDTENDPGDPFNDLQLSDKVKFVFRHMTSKIEVNVVIDDEIKNDVAYFTINSIGLTNILSSGTLTPSAAYNDETDEWETSFVWSALSRSHDYPVKTTECYLLLPQELGNTSMLTMDYDITFKSEGTTYTYDGSGNAVPGDTYTYTNSTASVQLNTLKLSGSEDLISEWLPNHHYIYTIRLTARRIEFTGTVVDFGEYLWTPLS